MACRKFDQEWPRRSASYAQTGVGRCMAVANLGRRQTVRLCLFLLDFCSDLRLREHERWLAQAEVHRTFTGLNDAAHIHGRPDREVPICLDRHNFATDNSLSALLRLPPRWTSARKGKGNRGLPSAKELGKRWRFFPTYAELQTSPLLRQSSSDA